jgi:prepilin signal peptidase PulO-like enzyme (type II secretory pathway)
MEDMISKGAKIIFATSYGHLDPAKKVAAAHSDATISAHIVTQTSVAVTRIFFLLGVFCWADCGWFGMLLGMVMVCGWLGGGLGLVWGWCAWRWGGTWTALAWAGFFTTLLALALIDADTMLLPDALTLPLMWAGLIAAQLGWTGLPLSEALWGAVAGYLSLWLVYQVFLRLTGKHGLGGGDFKLLAALGAWLGWQALPWLVLGASLLGLLFAAVLMWRGQYQKDQHIPLGPSLALAGAVLALWQPPVSWAF